MTAILVTVFCSFASLAEDYTLPRAVVYGALIGQTTSTSRVAVVNKINDSLFSVKPTFSMNAVTAIQLFIVVPSNVVTFDIKITALNGLTYPADGAFTDRVVLYKYDNGTFSNYTSIGPSTTRSKSTVDGRAVFEWHYESGLNNLNCISVYIPTNITVVEAEQLYNFRFDEFVVNDGDFVLDFSESTLKAIYDIIGDKVGDVAQFDPSAEIANSYNEASQAFQNDVDNFSGFIDQYNMRTTSERVMFPALLTLSTAGGDLSIILGVCIAACSAGSLIFALRRLHG